MGRNFITNDENLEGLFKRNGQLHNGKRVGPYGNLPSEKWW